MSFAMGTALPEFSLPAAIDRPPVRRIGRDDQLRLPLEWEVADGVPAIPGVPRHLRIMGEPGTYDTKGLEPLDGSWVARIARAIAEVSAGIRPATQLTRWVERRLLDRLADRGAAMRRHPTARAHAQSPHQWRGVRSVRLCPVADGIVEASAVLIGRERSVAIALRFEAMDTRWLVTSAELL